MFNGATELGHSPTTSGGATGGENLHLSTTPAPSQLPIKSEEEALLPGTMPGSDPEDPIPLQARTPAAMLAAHPTMGGLISSASSLLFGPNSITQATHSQLSLLPAGFATLPGSPTSIGHGMPGALGSGGAMSPQSTAGFPQSHHPIHTPQQQHMMLFQPHGLSGSATYHAFHNAGLSSLPPSVSSATSSYLGLAVPMTLPPQYSPQYANQQAPPPPPQIEQNQQQQQQQQQVVVLLPSTAKIDRLHFAQVVDAVSSALQRTVEFKDLLMTVAPTPLVVMEPESLAAGTDLVRPKVDKTEQDIVVRSDTQSATASVERKATETQTATAKCVSIETQTEDSEMLRAIIDKAADHHGADNGVMASNQQESVVWFNKSDLVKREQPATATNSSPPSRRRDSSRSRSGSRSAAGPPTQSTSRSALQQPPPLQSATNTTSPSRAPSQPPTARAQSTSASDASSCPPSPATSRLGARGLRPSALLTSPLQTPTPTALPTTSTNRTSSPAYFPAGPPRPLPTRPHLSHSPSLPPVPAPVINHPLTLVTPFRPANCGPAPYHVTLRNLRPSVTPSDLLYLARDLRSLVKVYYPPHAFFSFVGRAAVYFLGEETEAVEFGRWMQGQIQRGKLRVVYELTEANVLEAETRLGKGKVCRWQTLLAVTVYRPGIENMGPAKQSREVGREVVDGVERGVRDRMATGEREWVERIEGADAERHEGLGDDKVDAGDWKQWEADLCRLFEDEISAGGGAQQEQDDAAIEWVDHGEIAAMQGKTVPCTFRDSDCHVARYLLTAPLNLSNLALPNVPTRMLYRAVLTDVAWDRFEPLECKGDLLSTFRLWAACGRRAPMSWDGKDLDDHIQMGWGNATESPFISFSCDLEWAVYYTLKQEFVGGQCRKLYQIQVPECHLFGYDGDDEMLMAFVKSASEAFAHRFVNVYSYQELQIGSTARQFSQAWFAGRKELPIPTYLFAEWRELTRELLDK